MKNCHTCKGYGSACCRKKIKTERNSRLLCAMSCGNRRALKMWLDFGNAPLAESAWREMEAKK